MVLTLDQKKIEEELNQKRINQVEPFISNDDIESVASYLKSGGWVTEHNVSRNFEEQIASYVDRKYGIVVPNGTIAIYLSLLALGVGPGKKVAVPNLTMIATINAILWTGAKPLLVDVDKDLCMSYEKLIDQKNLHTVIYVPLNGRGGDGKKIETWCKKNNINLLEDSAHALGSNYSHKACGSLGDISVLSFTPHKIITTGQGGMILLDNNKYKNLINDLKLFNRRKDKSDWHKGYGLNFKFTDLQSSLGLSQFNKINKFVKHKKQIEQEYSKLINSEDVEVLKFKEIEVPWFFDIVVSTKKRKEQLIDYLNSKNIETRNFYPALSKQKYLENVSKTNLDYSEKMFNRLLWLPSSNNLTKKDVKVISEYINNFKNKE